MRRAANVAERRSDKMNVFIFLITGIYLSVMAVIDHRLQKIPVLPGVIGILVIAGESGRWRFLEVDAGSGSGCFFIFDEQSDKGCRRRRRCPCLSDDRSNAWLFWQHRTFDIKFVFFCYCFGVSPCFP